MPILYNKTKAALLRTAFTLKAKNTRAYSNSAITLLYFYQFAVAELDSKCFSQ